MTILVVTAVDAERDAVVRDLGVSEPIEIAGYIGRCVDTPAGPLHAFSGGVGPVAAAVTTANLLARAAEYGQYDCVISAGIAGGFRERVQTATLVVADRVTFADLGVLTDDGFLTPRDMGLGQDSTYAFAADDITRLLQRLRHDETPVTQGEILTLACMTGTDAGAEELAARYPHALAEAMEGFGVVHAVLSRPKIPRYVTEIRALSNTIGRRDRSTWEMPRAFDVLARAFATLVKEPLP